METVKTIYKSYKFRIYPTKKQVVILENTLELCRELYNAALQERRDAWRLNKVSISYYDQDKQLTEVKKIREDLKTINAQTLSNVLNRLDKTFNNFFRRSKEKQAIGFPRFKGQNRYNSFCYRQNGFSVSDNKLTLSKIGKLKLKLSRPVIGKVKTCTIKREIDKWFVIFLVETAAETLSKTGKQIGIDVGIEKFLTLSDGTQIENFKYFEKSQKKLRVAQRSIVRKTKGSNSRRKAVLKLKKIHQKIKNQRSDFQHKISTRLVKEFDLIAIENLNILGMSKGILSKQIHDVAWSAFFQKLKYKAENAGKLVIEVNPKHTSQDCSVCSERVKKDLSVRVHQCLNCGLILNRDENAAINILKAGQAFLAQTKTIRL